MGSLDPRKMMVIPTTPLRSRWFDPGRDSYREERGREELLDGRSVLRKAVNEWALRRGASGMANGVAEAVVDVVGRQMELRKAGFRESEGGKKFLEGLRGDLGSVEIRITMAIHDDISYEVGFPPWLPRELDAAMGNKPCKKCGLFILSGTWTPHTDFECNTKIVKDLMSR